MSQPVNPRGGMTAQPLDALNALFGGSFNLDNLKIEPPKPSAADENAAAAAARLAENPDFTLLLEWLADKTVRRPVGPPALGIDPAQGWAHVQRREGENSILFLFLALVAHGQGLPPPAREGA